MKKYQFTFRWPWLAATLLLLSLFISLGFWQLKRADEKTMLQHLYDSRLHMPPIPLQQLPKQSDLRYYPIKVSGYYDTAHSILLDNKIHQHRIGYEVLTPLIIDNQQPLLLINRGWIPAPANRQLPHLDNLPGPQTITGIIYLPSGKSFNLGKLTESEQWPLRMQNLNLSAITQILKKPVYPYVLLLNPNENHGFVRERQPVNMPAYKHQGYAFQWFTIAAALIIIFIVCNLRRKPISKP